MNTDVIAVPSLASLPLFAAVADSTLLYALVKSVHLFGVALLVGCVTAFDLRVLGVARSLPVAGLARFLLPLAVGAMVLIVPSGLTLFAVSSGELLSSGVFAVKMGLILAGGILAIVFHTGPYAGVAHWAERGTPLAARACALASIAGWASVLVLAAMLMPR